jgi:hypothetical protein
MRIWGIALLLVFFGLLRPWHSQAAAQQATADAVSTGVISEEKLAWEAAKKKDKAGLARLLSDDYTEIIDDGVFDKAGILNYLDNVTLTSYFLRDLRAKKIGSDVVLLTFQVTVTGKYKGGDFHAENNAASLWAKRSGTWQNVHFQETPVPK